MPSMEERCDGAPPAAAWLGGLDWGWFCGGGGLGEASRELGAIRRRFRGRKYSSPLLFSFRLPVVVVVDSVIKFMGLAFGGGGLGAPTDISEPAGLAGGGLVHNMVRVIVGNPIGVEGERQRQRGTLVWVTSTFCVNYDLNPHCTDS